MCLVIKKSSVTAGLKCPMDIFLKRYTPIATPTKGANAINGSPSLPTNLASMTTEPVANTTTMNVPITSATNLFWEDVSLAAILSLDALSNFLYSSFYIVSNLSELLNRFTFWVFNSQIYYIIYEK